jgi:hypothetical protein
MGHLGSTTSNHHRRPSQSYGQDRAYRGTFSSLHSLYRTQNNAVRYNALPHEPPQGDQKLARQGDDHGLASAAGALGAGSKPSVRISDDGCDILAAAP